MNKIFLKYSLIVLIISVSKYGYGQQVFLETGFNNAFFNDYKNSDGVNTLDNKYTKSLAPFAEIGFRFNLLKERLHANVGFGFNTYTINTAFKSGNISIPISYDLSYVALKYGINYSILKWKRLKLQLHAHLSHDWLTQGTYQYNDTVVDIYKNNSLDRSLFRFHRGASLEFDVSKRVNIYANYNYATSIPEKNQDSTDGETYELTTNSFSFGLLFKLNKN